MPHYVRVEPLRPDVKEVQLRRLLGDFGDIHRVTIKRAPKQTQYNRISKKRDIVDDTYALVSYFDRHAAMIAVSNFDNKVNLPITGKPFEVVSAVRMGQVDIRHALRVREHTLDN